jgi:hypothetical protein
MKEISDILSLSKRLKFKPLRTRVVEHEGKYLVFYSSIYYNLRNQPSRKEIHCFYYDDIQGEFYSFIPLIKILSDKDLKEKVIMDDQDDDPDFVPSSSESESEDGEDEEMELLPSVSISEGKREPSESDDLILDEVKNLKVTEEDQILSIERGLNDPTRFNIYDEAQEILLLEKNGFTSTDMNGYHVGFYHYQMQRIVIREVHYRASFAFLTIKKHNCEEVTAFDVIQSIDEKGFLEGGYNLYLESVLPKNYRVIEIEKIKNVEVDDDPISVTLL